MTLVETIKRMKEIRLSGLDELSMLRLENQLLAQALLAIKEGIENPDCYAKEILKVKT